MDNSAFGEPQVEMHPGLDVPVEVTQATRFGIIRLRGISDLRLDIALIDGLWTLWNAGFTPTEVERTVEGTRITVVM